jgi:hypothetical protein
MYIAGTAELFCGYGALVLNEFDPEHRNSVVEDLKWNVSKFEGTALESSIAYYRTPRELRWLRRRPVMPSYE